MPLEQTPASPDRGTDPRLQFRGRSEAAAEIWDWQATGQPEASTATGRPRLRGTIQAAVGAGAGVVFLLLASPMLATVAFTVAASLLASALISPDGLYAAIDRAFHALGHQIGRALSWLLLPSIFYLVFWPFGRLFRRGKRDTMKRSFDADAESYWQPHRGISPSKSYPRQF